MPIQYEPEGILYRFVRLGGNKICECTEKTASHPGSRLVDVCIQELNEKRPS